MIGFFDFTMFEKDKKKKPKRDYTKFKIDQKLICNSSWKLKVFQNFLDIS